MYTINQFTVHIYTGEMDIGIGLRRNQIKKFSFTRQLC